MLGYDVWELKDFGEADMSDKDKFLFYTANDGAVKVEVLYKDETVWLTQKALAELFGVQRPAITKHLKNIFETAELMENSVSSILETTAADGKSYGHLRGRCDRNGLVKISLSSSLTGK